MTTPLIEKDSIVLFQGDSITDAGRLAAGSSPLGGGYVNFAASWFSALHPSLNVTFHNRGVSGERVKDLLVRWDADCIALKPDCVSILIGINDTWRRYDSNDPTPVDVWERDYRKMLEITREKLNAKILMMEPFVLPVPEDRMAWREDLDPRIDAVRRLAREFADVFVPLDGIFAAASMIREPAYWAADGVHPTAAGHALIAQAWLKAVQAI